MYIENDIAYATEKDPLIKVSCIKPLGNYCLMIVFNTGERKIFDFKNLLNIGVYQKLKDVNTFNAVSLEYGVPVWDNGEIDIAPETLYQQGTTV